LDLTDYAGGDKSQIANVKAFEKHLKICTDCGTELKNLRKTFGVLMASEPRSEKFQKKMITLKQQIRLEGATRLLVEYTLMDHYPGAYDMETFGKNFKKKYQALVKEENKPILNESMLGSLGRTKYKATYNLMRLLAKDKSPESERITEAKYNQIVLYSRALKITEALIKYSIDKNMAQELNLLSRSKIKNGLESMFK
jgi:hypothetical protein